MSATIHSPASSFGGGDSVEGGNGFEDQRFNMLTVYGTIIAGILDRNRAIAPS